MPNELITLEMLAAVEDELRQAVGLVKDPDLSGLHAMLAYHMGWEGDGAGPEAAGKRIRPLLVLLSTAAAGGDWKQALPAAASVELIHNFSLIHDDIEDNSPLRRGRTTVWKRWGIAHAINAGDTMYALAHLSLHRLEQTTSAPITLQAIHLLQSTCLALTQGQYLDISYENRTDLTAESYWPMVAGKTATLLSACTQIGPLLTGAPPAVRAAYTRFGHALGLAFQVQDDFLGIWGDAALTGKSSASDLLSGKKSLPVLFGLERGGAFAERWAKGPICPDEVSDLAAQLEREGAYSYAQGKVIDLTQQALQALDEAGPNGEPGEALRALALSLVQRHV